MPLLDTVTVVSGSRGAPKRGGEVHHVSKRGKIFDEEPDAFDESSVFSYERDLTYAYRDTDRGRSWVSFFCVHGNRQRRLTCKEVNEVLKKSLVGRQSFSWKFIEACGNRRPSSETGIMHPIVPENAFQKHEANKASRIASISKSEAGSDGCHEGPRGDAIVKTPDIREENQVPRQKRARRE